MMDRADVTLAFLLAYIVAAALHAGLAISIQRRGYRAVEVRVFATANWMLAAWHLLQGVEYTQTLQLVELRARWLSVLHGAELLVGGLVLALFFQLFATFERRYRRQAPSLRAAITTHVHCRRRAYIPLAYGGVAVGMVLYAADSAATGGILERLRGAIGPTSAYLFGGSLLFMTFVLFPARPGQDKIPVPALGRAALLLSLGLSLGLIALWHDDHSRRVSLALLPWLNLQSVAFCVFLAFLRYEFSFLDAYVSAALRFLAWTVAVVGAYFLYNRMHFASLGYGRYLTSSLRIGVLLLAVAGGPWLGNRMVGWADRVLFARSATLSDLLRAFARRLGRARGLSELVVGVGSDLSEQFHAHSVQVVVGEQIPEEVDPSSTRIRLPLRCEGSPVGWLLMGERRNLYPYFDTELRRLEVVASLLAAAIVQLRRGEAEDEAALSVVPEGELAPEPGPSSRSPISPRDLEAAIDREWMAEVLEVGYDVADRDPEVAVEVLRRVHRIQKHLDDEGDRVPLSWELRFAQDYLALEKLRLRNRLEVVVGVDPRVDDPAVPRGILHPLLENAFRHGVGRQLRTGRVEIHVKAEEETIEVEVLDNGGGFPVGFDPQRLPEDGGLRRLQEKLERLMPDSWRLWVDTAARDGGAVRLYLNRS